jgi:hypothetical protein
MAQRLRIDVDPETWDALARSAVRDFRPVTMQAVVLLRRALGLPVPKEPRNPEVGSSEEEEDGASEQSLV